MRHETPLSPSGNLHNSTHLRQFLVRQLMKPRWHQGFLVAQHDSLSQPTSIKVPRTHPRSGPPQIRIAPLMRTVTRDSAARIGWSQHGPIRRPNPFGKAKPPTFGPPFCVCRDRDPLHQRPDGRAAPAPAMASQRFCAIPAEKFEPTPAGSRQLERPALGRPRNWAPRLPRPPVGCCRAPHDAAGHER